LITKRKENAWRKSAIIMGIVIFVYEERILLLLLSLDIITRKWSLWILF